MSDSEPSGSVRLSLSGGPVPEHARESKLVRGEASQTQQQAKPAWNDDDFQAAIEAVKKLAAYMEKMPTDVDQITKLRTTHTLFTIVKMCIAGLESGECSEELQSKVIEWPAMVPAGGIGGPLWKAWVKKFASMTIGKAAAGVPSYGGARFDAGKPAAFAWFCYQEIDSARSSVTSADSIGWVREAGKLQPLNPANSQDWVEVAESFLKFGPWKEWLKFLPERLRTAQTMEKTNMGLSPNYEDVEISEGTARLRWTPKSGHSLAKLSYAAECILFINPSTHDVKFGVGGGPILGSWSGGRSTVRSAAEGRAQPAAEASQNRGRMGGGLAMLGLLFHAAPSAFVASSSAAAASLS